MKAFSVLVLLPGISLTVALVARSEPELGISPDGNFPTVLVDDYTLPIPVPPPISHIAGGQCGKVKMDEIKDALRTCELVAKRAASIAKNSQNSDLADEEAEDTWAERHLRASFSELLDGKGKLDVEGKLYVSSVLLEAAKYCKYINKNSPEKVYCAYESECRQVDGPLIEAVGVKNAICPDMFKRKDILCKGYNPLVDLFMSIALSHELIGYRGPTLDTMAMRYMWDIDMYLFFARQTLRTQCSWENMQKDKADSGFPPITVDGLNLISPKWVEKVGDNADGDVMKIVRDENESREVLRKEKNEIVERRRKKMEEGLRREEEERLERERLEREWKEANERNSERLYKKIKKEREEKERLEREEKERLESEEKEMLEKEERERLEKEERERLEKEERERLEKEEKERLEREEKERLESEEKERLEKEERERLEREEKERLEKEEKERLEKEEKELPEC